MHFWSLSIQILAGLYGAVGVALSAWASHRSGGDLLMTAALFMILHAAPMLTVALAPPRPALLAGATIMALGALLFSGDLSLRLLAGVKPWPMAAPAGGVLLMTGWLWLACAGWRRQSNG